MRPFSHKFLRRGACGVGVLQPSGGVSGAQERGSETSKFLAMEEVAEFLRSKRTVWFGEYHSETRIVWVLEKLARSFLSSVDRTRSRPRRCLHVVFEHFSFEMQDLLDEYQSSKSTMEWSNLVEKYKEIGTEGHDLDPYRRFCELCRSSGRSRTSSSEGESGASAEGKNSSADTTVKMHGGFIPRPHASAFMKAQTTEEKEVLLENLASRGYLPSGQTINRIRRRLVLEVQENKPKLIAGREKGVGELPGSTGHFTLFESMMTSRDIYGIEEEAGDAEQAGDAEADDDGPNYEQYKKIFQAQLIKDWAMAFRIFQLMTSSTSSSSTSGSTDQFLIVAGRAHMQHRHGVPEVLRWLLEDHACQQEMMMDKDKQTTAAEKGKAASDGEDQDAMLLAQMMFEVDLDEKHQKADLAGCEKAILESPLVRKAMQLEEDLPSSARLRFEYPLADILFTYDEDDTHTLALEDVEKTQPTHDDGACPHTQSQGKGKQDADLMKVDDAEADLKVDDDDHDEVKKGTTEAYDRVGATASRPGNARKARAILTYLRYSTEQQEIIGDNDIYNYQGVGNPFRCVTIEKGERVIDLGSGLGVDTFLAAHYAGKPGRVLGVDISRKEVKHAQARAEARGVVDRVRFQYADIEKLADHLRKEHFLIELPAFDVAISNGAFCLAPDKRKAFQQVFLQYFAASFMPEMLADRNA